MSEERRYGINWVDLIIKIILVVLFVLLICWLFPMPKLDTFYDQVFNNNIQTMKNAAKDYYTASNLPTTVGETKSMTLKQLIDNKLVLDFSDKDGNKCDTTNSYVQVTKTLDNEYALKVQLSCGEESDYIIDTIGCNGTCLLSEVNSASTTSSVNTNNEVANTASSNYSSSTGSSNRGNKIYYYPLSNSSSTSTNNSATTSKTVSTTTTSKTYTTSTSNNISTTANSSSSSKKTYYQQAKIKTSYGSWIEGYKTGSNIETKTETVRYYNYTLNSGNSTSSVYRTSSYVEYANNNFTTNNYSYELQLTDIPSYATNVMLTTDRYFTSSDYQAYINTQNSNIYMTGNDMLSNSSNRSASDFKTSALKSGNFTYSISNPYKTNGVWRVRVYITLKNNAGVPVYYDYALGKKIYFVPVYFKVSYGNSNSKSYTDTEANSYKYPGYTKKYAYSDTVSYYRYINEVVDYNDTFWSTSKYVSGYKFTGNIKY